ncbi:hypothetical protein GCM10023147_28420 [Tsukamurella soli]|uniref:Uncharacterized protein n=1 Tax=Tsukamurella soli TaxID=644556 RepID=A0ABP8JSF2_9ACTN
MSSKTRRGGSRATAVEVVGVITGSGWGVGRMAYTATFHRASMGWVHTADPVGRVWLEGMV